MPHASPVAPELPQITLRIARLCERVRASPGRPSLLCEVEDALCDGYAHALAGDAWSMRAQARMLELIGAAHAPGGATGLHALAREHFEFEAHLTALRVQLSALKDEYRALRVRAPLVPA